MNADNLSMGGSLFHVIYDGQPVDAYYFTKIVDGQFQIELMPVLREED